jgi:N-acetylgalactosamine kinase
MVREARKAGDWLKLLSAPDADVRNRFARIYGEDADSLEEWIGWYRNVVRRFCELHGENREVIVVRAPGRINLIGMHIDHRGGHVNPIASREVIMVVEGREDDRVVLHNTDERFEPCSFTIGEELPTEQIDDWEGWTRERAQERARAGTAGHWSNYVKAPLVYLQDRLKGQRLRGMNAIVSGNIPQAAGLSSSSALVVCAAEASLHLNGLEFSPKDFVEFCGIAEWYVGTRGGAGDHAAIKFSRQGFLSHVGFFPLEVELVPFPKDCRVVICNTGVMVQKAAGARDIFNQRVAAYDIGLLLIKKQFPHFAPRLQHLRDLNAANLDVDEAAIYEVLLSLPQTVTRRELAEALPDQRNRLHQLYGTHAHPAGGYLVRQVCLYGLAECQRSKMAVEKLKAGDVKGFGELMNLSHEGDRVTRIVGGKRVPKIYTLPDDRLRELIADLRSGDPARINAACLYRQPGGYLVSCPEGDELVDIARGVEGVLGARLVGAGLGGCVAVLVRCDQVEELVRTVKARYYEPRRLAPAIEVCTPIEGSGVLAI